MLETARLADRLGYDLLGVPDHPYHPRHLDTLSLLGVILAQTERIRVFQDVGNVPLRPPAVFAKAAATLDLLSDGRFEAGLGGGANVDAAWAMGAPALTPGESLDRPAGPGAGRRRTRRCEFGRSAEPPMTTFEAKPETDRGRAMFEGPLWVHSAIRRDLEVVERLAADVGNGLPGEAVQATLVELKTAGPLWQLRVNCLRYCSFVHAHHGAEDVLLFPALRAANPSIAPAVDRAFAARRADLGPILSESALSQDEVNSLDMGNST